MRKRLWMLLAAVGCGLSLIGCGGAKEPAAQSDAPAQSIGELAKVEEPAEPLNLVGEWKQTNSQSDVSYQEAVITDDGIEVYWIATDSKSLYWAGTYDAPAMPDDEYSWESKNDTAKTEMAMLASSDATKKFTYKDGKLSYEVSALGTTITARLERK